MSEATLTSLLEYLYGTLTPSNMRWVGEHLIHYADSEENLKPYTMEEVHSMLDAAERNYETGLGIPSENVFRELEGMAHNTAKMKLLANVGSKAENRKQALKRDLTPEQLYSVISDEIDNIYA